MSKLVASPCAQLRKFGVWLKGRLIGDVQAEIAVCEYDCRRTQCLFEEWENCPNRLSLLTGAGNPKTDGRPKPNE